MTQTIALPSFDDATVVVPAPGSEPGNWSGAASATLVDGVYWLTYRVRRPIREGRGVSVVVARSEDGEHFVTVAEVRRDDFGAESFERPVLVRRPDGGWRLYVSCATPGSKHWWIEAVDADEPAGLETGVRAGVLPGTGSVAGKDPGGLVDETGWRVWGCGAPPAEPGHEDRMTTAYATSADGLAWDWHGTVLAPSAGSWDQRGTRVTAVLSESPLVVLYDGRATAEDNWHEVTGVARSTDGLTLVAEDHPVIRSPHSDGALRYVAAVPLEDGRTRFYFEAARPDGAHDLMTSIGG